MTKLLSVGVVLLAIPLLVIAALGWFAINAAGVLASVLQPQLPASDEALADIPPGLIEIYEAAAVTCEGLSWQVLAGIAKVESNHGRYGGSSIDANFDVWPPIIGIPLNGSNGTAVIRDTDNGVWDGDMVWDRAVGPFQFIPTSWQIFGRDGNGDGIADPNNIADGAFAAVAHLCPNGTLGDIEAALFGYNHSRRYVADVLAWADTYTAAGAVVSAGSYAYPLPAAYATVGIAGRPHHDYPAIDIGVPVGTRIMAMVAGEVITAFKSNAIYDGSTGRCGSTVTIAGIDGAKYTYCHLSAVNVTVGQTVLPGTTLGASGGQPGALGAGNTTGPHLHMSIKVAGVSVCPQTLLLGIIAGAPIAASTLPRSGCSY